MLTKTSMDLLNVGHEGEVSTVLVFFLHICSVEGLRSGPASRYLFIARLAHSLGVVIVTHGEICPYGTSKVTSHSVGPRDSSSELASISAGTIASCARSRELGCCLATDNRYW